MTYSAASIPSFPAGYGPLAADFTTWITDNFGFLTDSVAFRAQQTTSGGQSLSSGFNVLAFNSILEDPWSGWSAAGSGSQPADSWLAPVTGLYEITVTGLTTALAIWQSAAVQISGGSTVQGEAVLTPSGTVGGSTCSLITTLVAGVDYVQGGLAPSASCTTDTTSPARYPSMEIALVSL